MVERAQSGRSPWRERLNIIIFGHDTSAGKAFDIVLMALIGASILTVMLESVVTIGARYGTTLSVLEWVFTLLFTLEYLLRILSAPSKWKYILSFLGIVDLLSILPTYLSLFLPGSQALLTLRALRLLRIFRVLKLTEYLKEANTLGDALRASSYKIVVFLGTVLTISVIMGAFMYLLEGEETGFTSIPRSIYWAIVTMTTVGYGDIAPQSVPGQIMAAALMILGYAIIAVPTGIVSAELVHHRGRPWRECANCLTRGHDHDAKHCKICGAEL